MFLVCGEALWDLFAVEGEGLSFDARVGGSPLNVAVGLARLEQRAGLFTGLSTDRLGERLLGALTAEGVATEFLVRTQRLSTLSLVDVGADGSPRYAFYGEGAADRSITAADLPSLGAEVWGLHAGSYSLAVEPVGAALLAFFGREKGRRLLTLDPNVRLSIQPDVDLWRERIGRFLPCTDVVKVSDEDLGMLHPGRRPDEVAQEWLAAGPALVVVTRGAQGAVAWGAAGRVEIPGRPVQVVDTVGAGDTFQAALIAGLAERGAATREAVEALDATQVSGLLDFAVQAAAITCGRRGSDLPRRAELPAPAPSEDR
ncbi:carbohydrate kinase [Albimonas sp. CAU 1670]|uniref:carbohydrate kinase family protein n=1 Tax=Albimonas sp. CAU 1670 TaxID=3032599 RepID=UPI0023DCB42A|nr:carbohydrate kinase [Albimonas sp. CAU 1670]MDF2235438.1 carbohydrate kinase [Albimonas sp. CAU 1670]